MKTSVPAEQSRGDRLTAAHGTRPGKTTSVQALRTTSSAVAAPGSHC